MGTWDDVRRIALDLPQAVEDGSGRTTAWRVGSRAFAWERRLRRGERQLLGDGAPDGPALGVRVPDPDARDALLASRPGVYLALPAYDGYPMALLHVEVASFDDLDEAITESWLCRAPKKLVRAFLDGTGGP